MGQPDISQDTYGYDSKTTLDLRNSVDNGSPIPAQESRLQLFETSPSTEERQWQPDLRDWLVCINILILGMMDTFDATVMLPVLPELANTFDKPLVSTLWVNTVYLIFSTTSQLFFTMMCDVFSHGALWIISGVLSAVGSGICGGSTNLTELIIGRLVQGIGGGGATALCFVIMTDTAPEPIHSRYSCYILLTRLIGAMLGPAVGGLFIDRGNWTWTCYFNFVFCGLGLLLIPISVDLRVSKKIPLRRLRILDWSGTTMAFLGPSSILIGLSWGGILYGWLEWRTLMPIAVGLCTLIALILYESTWALHPQFGAKIFRSPAVIMTYIGCFCHGFVVLCQMQYFSLYLLTTKYFSPTVGGLALLALTGLGALTPAAVIGIVLASKPQFSKYLISGGWALTVLASGCSILLNRTTPTAGWVFLFFAAGLGHGFLLGSYNIEIHGMPRAEGSSFTTKPILISNFFRAWGMAFSIPLGGLVFLNMLGDELHNLGLRRDLINSANGYIVLMKQVHMSDDERIAIKDASASSLRIVWELITIVAAVGILSSAFLWKKR